MIKAKMSWVTVIFQVLKVVNSLWILRETKGTDDVRNSHLVIKRENLTAERRPLCECKTANVHLAYTVKGKFLPYFLTLYI